MKLKIRLGYLALLTIFTTGVNANSHDSYAPTTAKGKSVKERIKTQSLKTTRNMGRTINENVERTTDAVEDEAGRVRRNDNITTDRWSDDTYSAEAPAPAIEQPAPTSGQSGVKLNREGSSPDRFFRRVILNAALINAGYEGADTARYTRPNGFHAGLLMDVAGTKAFVFEVGALYRQLGTNFNNAFGSNAYTANYISIPVSAKYYFSGEEENTFFIKGGLVGSTLVSENRVWTSPTVQVGAQSWETAFQGGLGYKFAVSQNSDVILEADYIRAFDSVFKEANLVRSDINASLGLAVNL